MSDTLQAPDTDSANPVVQRLRAQQTPPAPPAPTQAAPPQAPSGIPTPVAGDPGVRIQQESAGQQFDKTGAPLTPAMFKGRPDEWNSPVGVTQVRPTTAYGFFPNVDLLRLQTDPGYNKAVGNAVHSALYQRYGNNATMADIAYNLGTGRLDHLLKDVGDPRKGQVSWDEFVTHLPAETQAYITANGSHSQHSMSLPPPSMSGQPQSGPTGLKEMFPVDNIFREMQATQFGALTEANENLKDVRKALDKLSEPPPAAQRTPAMEIWGSFAMAVAAIGGALTHTPAATSLDAMAGVMKAFADGDQERAKMQMDQWKAANNALLATTKMRVDLYNDAMSRYKSAPEQAKAELMANAAALNDQAMIQLLQTGDWQGAMAMGAGGIVAYQHLKEASYKTQQAMNDRLEAQRLISDLQAARESKDPQKIAAAEQALRDFNAIRAPAAASVNIESTTPATKQYSLPQEIQVTGEDGNKKQIFAQQDRNTGAWVTADENHTPLDAGGGSLKLLKGTQGDSPPSGDPTVEANAKLIAEYRMASLSGFVLRSPFGQAVMARVAQLNPDYNANTFGERAKAQKDFGTGAQGNQVRSFNVAVNHLDTLDRLIGALQNGDVRRINALAKQVEEETGSTAPTNFDAVRQIIGQEVVKAIIAGGGGVTERQQAGEIVDRARSPEQLHSAVDTLQELMVGQLKGLKQQYEQSTGLKNFESLLSDRTKTMVGKTRGGTQSQSGHPDELPEGTVVTQGGVKYRKTDGQWVPLQ